MEGTVGVPFICCVIRTSDGPQIIDNCVGASTILKGFQVGVGDMTILNREGLQRARRSVTICQTAEIVGSSRAHSINCSSMLMHRRTRRITSST